MNLRAQIYQNLQEQKRESENDLKTARLRQLEAESHKDELELKATNSTIDFEKCDLPAPVLGRETSNVTVPLHAGVADDKKTRQNGDANKARTKHFIECLSSIYDGTQTHYYLQDELRIKNSELWGGNEHTYKKWWQSSQAKPAKELLYRIKLKARENKANSKRE